MATCHHPGRAADVQRLLQFYMARMLRRPDMENQTRYGHVEKVQPVSDTSVPKTAHSLMSMHNRTRNEILKHDSCLAWPLSILTVNLIM